MHISDQVKLELLSSGWQEMGSTFVKKFAAREEAGALSDGSRIIVLRIDASGRWLERHDGWGNVEKDVDLRSFSDAPREAVAAVLS